MDSLERLSENPPQRNGLTFFESLARSGSQNLGLASLRNSLRLAFSQDSLCQRKQTRGATRHNPNVRTIALHYVCTRSLR